MGVYFDRYSLNLIDKPFEKIDQVHRFVRELASSHDTAAFFVFLSNDWKAFLSKGGELIGLNEKAVKKWKELSPVAKSSYNASLGKPLTQTARKHIELQFDIYINILYDI